MPDKRTLLLLAGAGLLVLSLILWRSELKNIILSARVAWGEARNQGSEGIQAVLNVMTNRANDRRWPNSLGDVAVQRMQFSAYNENDPNRAKLEAVTDANPIFAEAVEFAALAVRGSLPDVTGGATHYHTRSIAPPYWAKGATVTARIGDHIFYKGVR